MFQWFRVFRRKKCGWCGGNHETYDPILELKNSIIVSIGEAAIANGFDLSSWKIVETSSSNRDRSVIIRVSFK